MVEANKYGIGHVTTTQSSHGRKRRETLKYAPGQHCDVIVVQMSVSSTHASVQHSNYVHVEVSSMCVCVCVQVCMYV